MSILKQEKIDKVFKPDINGISDWISRDTVNKEIKKTGNNGIMRNGRPSFCSNDNRYIWETKRNRRSITHFRINGFNKNQKKKRYSQRYSQIP